MERVKTYSILAMKAVERNSYTTPVTEVKKPKLHRLVLIKFLGLVANFKLILRQQISV